jgi:hypothetical protein
MIVGLLLNDQFEDADVEEDCYNDNYPVDHPFHYMGHEIIVKPSRPPKKYSVISSMLSTDNNKSLSVQKAQSNYRYECGNSLLILVLILIDIFYIMLTQ